jgi:hypothetical protein
VAPELLENWLAGQGEHEADALEAAKLPGLHGLHVDVVLEYEPEAQAEHAVELDRVLM